MGLTDTGAAGFNRASQLRECGLLQPGDAFGAQGEDLGDFSERAPWHAQPEAEAGNVSLARI